MAVESERVRKLNQAPVQQGRKYVLYWAQMNRRVDANHGLLYAAEIANQHQVPVLFYEGLTCSYPLANDRLHSFVLEGVAETAKRLKKHRIGYCFYLRKKRTDANDVLYRLAKDAAAVVTDDYPTFIARTHNARVPNKIDAAYYVVDSSCVVPMNCFEKREYAAYTMRPKLHRVLREYLRPADSLKVKRAHSDSHCEWHTDVNAANIPRLLADCEIDHSVHPSTSFEGGRVAAEKTLTRFLENSLRRYARGRNDPAQHATSEMSPYLHFGQISSLEIALAASEFSREHKLIASEYLEELIVRRELAFNFVRFVGDPGSLANLPEWARQTMQKHAKDKRDPVYSREQLEGADTYDELWNATQKELLIRGKIHGYYRMYWGKKIIEWSQSHQEAADTMIYLHDRYALDGRDPNTYTNVMWCFGLHDRPWAERPIFGQLRYMSLEGMKRKTDTAAYIKEITSIEATGRDPYRNSSGTRYR